MKKLTISMKSKIEGNIQTTDFKVKNATTAKKVSIIIDSMEEVLPILSHSSNIENTYLIKGKKMKAKKVKSILRKYIDSQLSNTKKKEDVKPKKETKAKKSNKDKKENKSVKSKKSKNTETKKKSSDKAVKVRRK